LTNYWPKYIAQFIKPNWNISLGNSPSESEVLKLIKSSLVNLEKNYRNFGDIALISSLIFNNDSSLLNQKIKELEKDNNSKEITISKSIEKDIPKDLLFSITSHLKELNISTSNLSNKKYIFDESIDYLLLYEKVLVDKIFQDLQSHMILCEKNSGIWSVE